MRSFLFTITLLVLCNIAAGQGPARRRNGRSGKGGGVAKKLALMWKDQIGMKKELAVMKKKIHEEHSMMKKEHEWFSAEIKKLKKIVGGGEINDDNNDGDNNNDDNDNNCEGEEVKLKFSGVKVSYNNLGGKGPNKDDPEMVRFQKVGSYNGKAIDLIVNTYSDKYMTPASQLNGVYGHFAHLAVATGYQADLNMSFVDSESSDPVILPKFYISFFDFDSGSKRSPGTEVVEEITSRSSKYFLSSPTELYVSSEAGGYTSFKATKYGTGADNPMNPMKLTPPQARRSVAFLFCNTDRFDVSFSVSKGSGAVARDIFFAGKSSIVTD